MQRVVCFTDIDVYQNMQIILCLFTLTYRQLFLRAIIVFTLTASALMYMVIPQLVIDI